MDKEMYLGDLYRVVRSPEEQASFGAAGWKDQKEPGKKYKPYTADEKPEPKIADVKAAEAKDNADADTAQAEADVADAKAKAADEKAAKAKVKADKK